MIVAMKILSRLTRYVRSFIKYSDSKIGENFLFLNLDGITIWKLNGIRLQETKFGYWGMAMVEDKPILIKRRSSQKCRFFVHTRNPKEEA
jgi:hypothetical protein